jgi:hypothetical protein
MWLHGPDLTFSSACQMRIDTNFFPAFRLATAMITKNPDGTACVPRRAFGNSLQTVTNKTSTGGSMASAFVARGPDGRACVPRRAFGSALQATENQAPNHRAAHSFIPTKPDSLLCVPRRIFGSQLQTAVPEENRPVACVSVKKHSDDTSRTTRSLGIQGVSGQKIASRVQDTNRSKTPTTLLPDTRRSVDDESELDRSIEQATVTGFKENSTSKSANSRIANWNASPAIRALETKQRAPQPEKMFRIKPTITVRLSDDRRAPQTISQEINFNAKLPCIEKSSWQKPLLKEFSFTGQDKLLAKNRLNDLAKAIKSAPELSKISLAERRELLLSGGTKILTRLDHRS